MIEPVLYVEGRLIGHLTIEGWGLCGEPVQREWFRSPLENWWLIPRRCKGCVAKLPPELERRLLAVARLDAPSGACDGAERAEALARLRGDDAGGAAERAVASDARARS